MATKRTSKAEREASATAAKKSSRSKSPEAVPQPAPAQGTVAQQGSTAELQERIRRRAYEIHLARGGHGGADRDDWLQAEAEILGITGGG